LQRFRNGEIHEGKHTNLPDQGIRFNKDGHPWDKYQSPSRDSRDEKKSTGPTREPASSHAGLKGSPGGGDSGGDDSSDDHLTSDTSSDEDKESDSPSSDEEDDSNRQSRRKRSGNSKLFSYQRARTSGAETYQEGSSRWPSKYLKVMHKKFHKQIDRKISVLCSV
jgi:hypothetical protein